MMMMMMMIIIIIIIHNLYLLCVEGYNTLYNLMLKVIKFVLDTFRIQYSVFFLYDYLKLCSEF